MARARTGGTVPALIAELENALPPLDDTIRGLEDISQVSISGELRQEDENALENHTRRRNLIQAALDALVALDADGYPAPMPEEISADLFDELKHQMADLAAAAAVFTPTAPTVGFNITIDTPTPNPGE